ncbi:MAG: MerR family transcriptional regulator [Gammaproteobacteria bacterium]|nr:MAG: MerR family transcriptional regulator [Gammaproteobacteria bacterium]
MSSLPSIPDKKYFSIKEVSELCEVKSHTLRFWEKEFDTLKPETKGKGSRRVYQKDDLLMVRQIRSLLYEEGLTIAGAKKRLNSKTSSNKFRQMTILSMILKRF